MPRLSWRRSIPQCSLRDPVWSGRRWDRSLACCEGRARHDGEGEREVGQEGSARLARTVRAA
jgi:hypothetical protein